MSAVGTGKRLGEVLSAVEQINTENFYIVAALRLLMLTGARVGEIRGLLWKSVDLERGLLILPDSKTGQKTIRLNAQAIAILGSLPRVDGNPHVIIGRREFAQIDAALRCANGKRGHKSASTIRAHLVTQVGEPMRRTQAAIDDPTLKLLPSEKAVLEERIERSRKVLTDKFAEDTLRRWHDTQS